MKMQVSVKITVPDGSVTRYEDKPCDTHEMTRGAAAVVYNQPTTEAERVQQLFDLAKDGERFLQTGNIFIYRFSSTSMGNSPTEIEGLEPIAHWVMNGTWRRA
jgi:hypothetical protein